jgi:hypothetical protein
MAKNDLFHLNYAEKVSISAYLGKIKKQYTTTHFAILLNRGILNEDGSPTRIGDKLLKDHNGGNEYARQPAKKRRRARRKRK